MKATSCPSKETLSGYLTGAIPEDLAETVAAHLAACGKCEQTVQALETVSDPLIAALRQQPPADAPAAEP